MIKLAMQTYVLPIILAIFLTSGLAVTNFLGYGPKKNIVINPTPTVIPTATPTVVNEEIIEIITPTTKIIITPKPTIKKPTTSINEEILKKFFGINDLNVINQILNNKEQLTSYENNYYKKYKTLPIPRLNLDLKKLYGMPSKNGTVICTGTQLKSLYDEIGGIEKDYIYKKMDYDCHHNRNMQETKECQDWRRDNDQNRPTEAPKTPDELAKQIEEYTQKLYNEAKNPIYDQLLEKYCK